MAEKKSIPNSKMCEEAYMSRALNVKENMGYYDIQDGGKGFVIKNHVTF